MQKYFFLSASGPDSSPWGYSRAPSVQVGDFNAPARKCLKVGGLERQDPPRGSTSFQERLNLSSPRLQSLFIKSQGTGFFTSRAFRRNVFFAPGGLVGYFSLR